MVKAIISKASVTLTVLLIIFAVIFERLILFLLAPIPVFCGLVILVMLNKKGRGGVIKTLAFCPQCNKIILVPGINQGLYLSDKSSIRFQKKHLEHGHIFLNVVSGTLRNGKIEDPMVPSYFAARQYRGGKIFLIERSKKRVDSPMRYKILTSPPSEIRWRWRLTRLCLW